MPINFTQIIKDSFHFMQNEKRNILLLSMLYFFVDIIMVWLQFVMLPNEIVMSLSNNQIASTISEEQGIDLVTFFFLKQLIYIFISAWCLVSIHQISLRRFHTIWQSFSSTLKRILGAILLSFLIFIPILIGLTEAMIAIQQKVQPSIISLFAIVIGIGLYIRLCLAPVHYLLTNDSISHSAKITWRAAMGRVSVLFIFCLLIYVLIPFVENFLTAFSSNAITALISGILVALINVFALVVTYRFYTLFISKA
jgi:uncharacterized protein HI_0825